MCNACIAYCCSDFPSRTENRAQVGPHPERDLARVRFRVRVGEGVVRKWT